MHFLMSTSVEENDSAQTWTCCNHLDNALPLMFYSYVNMENKFMKDVSIYTFS